MTICNMFTQLHRGFWSGAGFGLGLGLSNFVSSSLFGYRMPFMPMFGQMSLFGGFYPYTMPSIQMPDFSTMQMPMNFGTYSTDKTETSIFDNSKMQNTNFGYYNLFSYTPAPIQVADAFILNSDKTEKADKTEKQDREEQVKKQSNKLQKALVDKAVSFEGMGGAEAQKRFAKGQNVQWCAAFVSTLLHEIYGNKLPSGLAYPELSANGIKNWGIKNNRFMELKGTKAEKEASIAKNVKAGDILIMSDDKGVAGHVGIVTKVNPDGSYETIEGNYSNKVCRVDSKRRNGVDRTESNGKKHIAGFVKLSDIA